MNKLISHRSAAKRASSRIKYARLRCESAKIEMQSISLLTTMMLPRAFTPQNNQNSLKTFYSSVPFLSVLLHDPLSFCLNFDVTCIESDTGILRNVTWPLNIALFQIQSSEYMQLWNYIFQYRTHFYFAYGNWISKQKSTFKNHFWFSTKKLRHFFHQIENWQIEHIAKKVFTVYLIF